MHFEDEDTKDTSFCKSALYKGLTTSLGCKNCSALHYRHDYSVLKLPPFLSSSQRLSLHLSPFFYGKSKWNEPWIALTRCTRIRVPCNKKVVRRESALLSLKLGGNNKRRTHQPQKLFSLTAHSLLFIRNAIPSLSFIWGLQKLLSNSEFWCLWTSPTSPSTVPFRSASVEQILLFLTSRIECTKKCNQHNISCLEEPFVKVQPRLVL